MVSIEICPVCGRKLIMSTERIGAREVVRAMAHDQPECASFQPILMALGFRVEELPLDTDIRQVIGERDAGREQSSCEKPTTIS